MGGNPKDEWLALTPHIGNLQPSEPEYRDVEYYKEDLAGEKTVLKVSTGNRINKDNYP